MPTFRATHKSTEEISQYTEETIRPEHLGPDWSVEEIAQHVPPPDLTPEEKLPPPVYQGRKVLTKREFLMLFTQQERISLRTVAKGNSQAAAMVEDYMFLLDQSQDVTLTHPDTIAGLQMLEAGGLLDAGRAAEILRG